MTLLDLESLFVGYFELVENVVASLLQQILRLFHFSFKLQIFLYGKLWL